MRASVSRNVTRYILIAPRWALLVRVIRGRLWETTDLGPTFSSQV